MDCKNNFQIYEAKEQDLLLEKKVVLTPYMSKLIQDTNSTALKKQFLPLSSGSNIQYCGDYLNEDQYMPVPHLIHRYKSKVIVIVTNQCACYCQFCTRQRMTRSGEITLNNLKEIMSYIKNHTEIKDVLVTGGDPFMLSTKKIIEILQGIQSIEHVKIMRIGTRIPITLPQRIAEELIEALKQFSNLYINIHINHPDELTPNSKKAILSLANAGIPLGSQSVLLKGINDDYDVLKDLFEQLIGIKVKPYYLYQCDKVTGCEDFVVDVEKGIDIINRLWNQTSGLAVPKFVVDTPQMGKMVLAPSSINRIEENRLYLSNSSGSCLYQV